MTRKARAPRKAPPRVRTPDPRLSDFDLILLNSSAGKDSQAMLTKVVELADAQGVDRSRLVVVHAELGRVEWAGTRELAQRQAEIYGLRFEVVARREDLLAQVLTRRATLDAAAAKLQAQAQEAARRANALLGAIVYSVADDATVAEFQALDKLAQELRDKAEQKRNTPAWPSSTARYCTSDQKTSQVQKLITREVAAWRESTGLTRPMRILNCLGIRSDESTARSKKEVLVRDSSASNGKREVIRWHPIFHWTAEEVWATIRRSGVPYHPAYDAGMPRLSCVLCILAGRRELVVAARLNPGLTRAYVEVERKVGHTFKADLSIEEVAREAGVLAAEPAAVQ